MTVKELLIKFQEYQLEDKVLNANYAHNTAANLFMERYGVNNCTIPDVSNSAISLDKICQLISNKAEMPYTWEDVRNRLLNRMPLAFKLKDE